MKLKIKVPYGFNHIVVGTMTLHTIKLRFSGKNTDNMFDLFFSNSGFIMYFGKENKSNEVSKIYMYQTSDINQFESTTKSIREYLIRRKITSLYEKLISINPTVNQPQSMVNL